MEIFLQMKLLFQHSHQYVDAEGGPNLGLHCVGRGAKEALDMQVLLDPFEEQFDLPATLVQLGDGQCRQAEVVGQIDKEAACLGVEEANTPQSVGVALSAVVTRQPDDLIGTQAGLLVDRQRMHTSEAHAALGTDDEKCALLFEYVQPGKIQIATVHDVEGSRLDGQLVERVDIVQFPVADMHESGNRAAQVQQRVQFDGGLGPAKACPAKQAQTQIDGRGIESVNRSFQVGRQGLVGVQSPSFANQVLRKVRIQAPVALLVGVGQRTASDGTTQAHVKQGIGSCPQAVDRIAQALPKRQLCKRHAQKLIPTGEIPNASFPAVAQRKAVEHLGMNLLHQLSKNRTACIHPASVPDGSRAAAIRSLTSNRSQFFSSVTRRKSTE